MQTRDLPPLRYEVITIINRFYHVYTAIETRLEPVVRGSELRRHIGTDGLLQIIMDWQVCNGLIWQNMIADLCSTGFKPGSYRQQHKFSQSERRHPLKSWSHFQVYLIKNYQRKWTPKCKTCPWADEGPVADFLLTVQRSSKKMPFDFMVSRSRNLGLRMWLMCGPIAAARGGWRLWHQHRSHVVELWSRQSCPLVAVQQTDHVSCLSCPVGGVAAGSSHVFTVPCYRHPH
jgi:hypothetical protein